MGPKMVSAAILFLFFEAWVMLGQGADFDVKNYGAKADESSDDYQAFMSVWKGACTCTDPSRFVVLGGTSYMACPVQFEGPCKAPMGVRTHGILNAPTGLNSFKLLQDGQVIFLDIDSLIVSGGGFQDI